MRRTTVSGLIAIAVAATLGCGSTTDDRSAGKGGSSGSSRDASADGRSGGNAGGTGGVSISKVTIEFTVTGPDSYCMTSQCGGPSIAIADSRGNALALETVETSCNTVDCSTCEGTACPNFFCEPAGIAVTGAQLDWDGTYMAPGTCGSGTACVAATHARAGKYTATLCATPGKLTGPDGGQRQCVTSGSAKCGHVDFDFPSTAVVKGTVGP